MLVIPGEAGDAMVIYHPEGEPAAVTLLREQQFEALRSTLVIALPPYQRYIDAAYQAGVQAAVTACQEEGHAEAAQHLRRVLAART